VNLVGELGRWELVNLVGEFGRWELVNLVGEFGTINILIVFIVRDLQVVWSAK
jgi:hypothetical protein